MRYGYFDSEIIGVDDEGMPIFDRAENSELFAMLFANLVSDGVLAYPADCLRVTAGISGLEVNVAPGFGMVKGHFGINEETVTLQLEAAPRSLKRIDRVIFRVSFIDRMVELAIKTGTPAQNPRAPGLERPDSGDYYELCLANVLINPNQISLTQANITDTRPDSTVCGYITQLIDHLDTAVFMAQFYQLYDDLTLKANDAYADYSTMLAEYERQLQEAGTGNLTTIIENFNVYAENMRRQMDDLYQSMLDLLDGTAAGKLQNQLNEHEERITTTEHMVIKNDIFAPIDTGDGKLLAIHTGAILLANWQYEYA